MKIIFVRHGETVDNRDKIVQGQRPGALSKLGTEQAVEVAELLRNEHIDAIYSSDLTRAADTAKEIAKYHPNAPLSLVTELRERSYGDWEGKTRDEVGWEKLEKERWALGYRPGGGETLEEVYKRLKKLVTEALGKHKNDTVLFVGHAASGRVLFALLEGKGAEAAEKATTHIGNVTIRRFEIDRI